MPKGLPDSFLATGLLRLGRRAKRGGRGGGGRPTYYRLVNLVLYKPILNFELRNMYGTVGRYIRKVGHKVAWGARAQVGVKTGALKASIRMRSIKRFGETAVKIGAYTNYALLHHEGTKPHVITPNKPGGQLVFMKGTRLIRTPMVMHPGTKPNKYLTRQLRPSILRGIKPS
tara:strand:+ start:662 stop:1177 length:516 start_codon:yes stop_codon:yes gene_type:complete